MAPRGSPGRDRGGLTHPGQGALVPWDGAAPWRSIEGVEQKILLILNGPAYGSGETFNAVASRSRSPGAMTPR